MPAGQLSDEDLAVRTAEADETALEVLFERYAMIVLGIALKVTADRATAEDVLQETFWRVWQSAATYQPQRGSFAVWLFRIARNLAIDAIRRRKARPRIPGPEIDTDLILDQAADPVVDVPEQAQARLRAQQVRKALKMLPPEQRQVIEMAYFQGMTRHMIAQATGEALGTIHTRARLGLQKLRKELEKAGFEL